MPRYKKAPQLTNAYIASVWETLPRYVRSTLLLQSETLSAQLGCDVTIASETFQYTGSFKFRAAYNLLASITESRIVTASSGNYGQAVAYACKLLGKKCTVVMPATSAQVKIAAVQSHGGVVDLIDVQKIRRDQRAGLRRLSRGGRQLDAWHGDTQCCRLRRYYCAGWRRRSQFRPGDCA